MIVYESKSSSNDVKKNLKSILLNFKNDLYIGYRLARKDIKSNYIKSYFGVFWDFIEPIALATVFIFLHKSHFLNTGDMQISYAIFVIYGLLMWQIFQDTLLKSLEILNQSKTLLSQLNVSSEALIMSIVFKMGFNSIFVLAAIIIFSIMMGEFYFLGMISFILLFPIVIFMGLGIGLFLAPFHTINSDVGSFIKIVLRALFFTSGVLFPLPQEGILRLFCKLNPIAQVFTNMRYLGIGHSVNWLVFGLVGIGFMLLSLIASYIFHISLRVLNERI